MVNIYTGLPLIQAVYVNEQGGERGVDTGIDNIEEPACQDHHSIVPAGENRQRLDGVWDPSLGGSD